MSECIVSFCPITVLNISIQVPGFQPGKMQLAVVKVLLNATNLFVEKLTLRNRSYIFVTVLKHFRIMKIKPTDGELEILQVLWKRGPSSVREINEVLNEKREIGYTTTLKLMQIMVEKGIVLRDTSSRSHIYFAGIKETDTTNTLLKDFINATFHGSAMSMVMQALGNTKATPEEIQELKSLIKNLETNH